MKVCSHSVWRRAGSLQNVNLWQQSEFGDATPVEKLSFPSILLASDLGFFKLQTECVCACQCDASICGWSLVLWSLCDVGFFIHAVKGALLFLPNASARGYSCLMKPLPSPVALQGQRYEYEFAFASHFLQGLSTQTTHACQKVRRVSRYT